MTQDLEVVEPVSHSDAQSYQPWWHERETSVLVTSPEKHVVFRTMVLLWRLSCNEYRTYLARQATGVQER